MSPGCSCTELAFSSMLSRNKIVSSLFICHFPAVTAEGMPSPQRILFPPEMVCMEWRQRQRAGAGLHNLDNTCFLNSVLQCLTYTPPLANYLLSGEHSQACEYFYEHLLLSLLGTSHFLAYCTENSAQLSVPPKKVF